MVVCRTRHFAFLLAGGLLLACGKEAGEPIVPPGPYEWSVRAAADKSEVQVGEDLTVTVTVSHPPNADFFLATGAELEPFELIERVDETPSPIESVITVKIGAYLLPADVDVPPIKVEYRDESEEIVSMETEPIPIKVVTSLTPEITDINDIKGPIEDIPMPSRWSLLWWLLAALLAAIVAYLLYRKFRKDKVVPVDMAPAPPPIPPEIEAERALRKLADEQLLEQGRFMEFYTRLHEIMKRYAGRRYDVPYYERTTTEILSDLKKSRLKFEMQELLRGILLFADLVKFARVEPLSEDSERMIPESFRFLDETRPKAEVRTPDEPSKMEATA
jgi:hypothetical protein